MTGARGIGLALGAAVVSGCSVWLNSTAVSNVATFADPGTYTTAKNLLAGLVLVVAFLVVSRRGARQDPGGDPHGPGRSAVTPWPRRSSQWVALLAVSVVGGSVPFLLFFEGLAASGSPVDAQAAHKASLLMFVAVFGPLVLRERIGALQGVGLLLVVGGYLLAGNDLAALGVGRGLLLVVAAAALWAVESVIDRWLLADIAVITVATVRLAVGTVWLLCIGVVTGDTGRLTDLTMAGWAWAAVTGVVLAAYVTLWMGALSGAQAVDVTAVLALAVPVTAVVDWVADGSVPASPLDVLLLAAGAVVVAVGAAGAVPALAPRWLPAAGSGRGRPAP